MADIGIERIEKNGESYHVQGVKDGERTAVLLPAQAVEQYEKAHGRKATEDMLRRKIDEGVDYQRSQR